MSDKRTFGEWVAYLGFSGFFLAVIGCAVFVPILFWQAFVIIKLWSMFIVSYPPPQITQLVGLLIIYRVFSYSSKNQEVKFVKAMTQAFLNPLVALIVGFVVSKFL